MGKKGRDLKMKKIFSIAVVFILLCSCFPMQIFAAEEASSWDGTIDTSWYSEEREFYQISSASQLAGLFSLVNNGTTFEGKTVRLYSNIVLNRYSDWSDWDQNTAGVKKWTPIGTEEAPFKGIFDGQGCSVIGLYVSSNNDNVGLFGFVQNAMIKNVNVIYAYVAGVSNVGAVCGHGVESNFLHCHSEANVVGHGTVGGMIGLVARNEKAGVHYVKECVAKGSVKNTAVCGTDEYFSSYKATGGVIGTYASRMNGDVATIENCANYAYVQGESCVGGVVGKLHTYYTQEIVVRNCINDATVESNDKRAGGIIGYNYQDGTLGTRNVLTIENCVNYGTVSGASSSLGGILGFSHICPKYTSCTIKNSVNLNTVNAIRGDRDTRYGDKVQVQNSSVVKNAISLSDLKTQYSFGGRWTEDVSGRICLVNSRWDTVNFDNLTSVSEVTCKDAGQTSCICSLCDLYLGESVIDPLGHVNAGWIVDREPTCKVAGERHFVCTLCNGAIKEPIEVVDCSYSDWVTVRGNVLIPPIVKEKSCTMCNDTQTITDWSYTWVTVVAGVALVGILIGVINYIRVFKRK